MPASRDNDLTALDLFMRDIQDLPTLPPEEQRELCILAQQGDTEARDKLVKHTLRLIVNRCKPLRDRGCDFMDLIQDAALSFCKDAIRKYDPAKGIKFSTYACWWIQQGPLRGIQDRGSTIRRPVHIHEVTQRIIAHKEDCEKKGEPTNDKEFYLTEKSKKPLTEWQVEYYQCLSAGAYSLDNEVSSCDRTHGTYKDTIPDESPLPDTLIEEHDRKTTLLAAVARLDPRSRLIVEKRHGLNGNEKMTLAEIGITEGVCKERIRQLEQIAMKELKKHLKRARWREEARMVSI